MVTSAAGWAAWADCCVAHPASSSTAPADRVVRLAAVRKDRRGSRMAVSDISFSLVLVGAWLRLMQARLRRSPEKGRRGQTCGAGWVGGGGGRSAERRVGKEGVRTCM